ncbi:MAG: hypothetical protein LBG42_07740 [Treponema sp.]|jgi:hypothetical protein|nr:hypothetical protein [Treponema sp.]
MKKKGARTVCAALFIVFVPGIFIGACTPGGKGSGETSAAGPSPLVLLRPGENPLWFELSPDGPRNISAPEDASLIPFVPWTAARHIRDMLPLRSGGLAMAVNRGGFLWTGKWAEAAGGETGLYYRSVPYWGEYTVVSFFLLDGQPSVLLSRDDFFSEPSVPVPRSRVWSADVRSGKLLERGAAFADFPPEGGWDIDALRPGGGGWYYRAALKDPQRPQYHYFRTGALFEKGEEIPVARFRGALEALPLNEAPSSLAPLLRAAALRIGETAHAWRTAASVLMAVPGFPAIRVFSLLDGIGAGVAGAHGADADGVFLGFYRPGKIPLVLVVSPDGKGCLVTAGGAKDYSLPPLPEGFVYTGAGMDGDTLFASWEEQQDYNIGAAGFMAVRLSL